MLLPILALGCFASSVTLRVVDPMVPTMARDFGLPVATVALLASAYAFPYALGQPVFGSLGDAFGKARIIKTCLALLSVLLLLSSLAPTFETLFTLRLLSGLVAGGVIPVSFALVGDRVPFEQRQTAVSRMMMVLLTAQIVGIVGTGLIGSVLGWRAVMAIAAGLAGFAVILLLALLPAQPPRKAPQLSLGSQASLYRRILFHPHSAIVNGGVVIDGLILFGLTPFIASTLEARGAGGVREAGFALAGLGLGGIVYALTITGLTRHCGGPRRVMQIGGCLALAGLTCVAGAPTWETALAGFFVTGYGFYMTHNVLVTQATELAPDNRGSAMAVHAFSFFAGQSLGPPIYGAAIPVIGTAACFVTAGLVLATLSFVASSVLFAAAQRPDQSSSSTP